MLFLKVFFVSLVLTSLSFYSANSLGNKKEQWLIEIELEAIEINKFITDYLDCSYEEQHPTNYVTDPFPTEAEIKKHGRGKHFN